MIAQQIAFGILAATMVLASLRLVTTKNVVHAGLLLAVVLGGAAGIFVLLAAEYVAVVQILVYIGAVVVILLFGTMLTRARIGEDTDLDNDQRWLAAIVALFMLGVTGTVLWQGFRHAGGDGKVHLNGVQRAAQVSDLIFGPYGIPFEVASVLLLAALVGAVAIARRD
ncbi:MAG: NADH:ubiquinone oxidoreductase subunit 6 [Acidimicrobiales bacterium]|jgi:NADH-quinone oxidoreductase subunit J|nr:NADH:ubiquinone oxidoreductase subunit 6 [Acidimicrobiales bacterium]